MNRKTISVTDLTEQQKDAIVHLWNCEYPAQLAYRKREDFDSYLDGLLAKEHVLLLDDDNIVGWAIAFDRGGERWFAIIIDSSLHGMGYGTLLLNILRSKNQQLAGWVTDHERYIKANGRPYRSPLGFYLKNGFTVRPDVRLEIEHLSAARIDCIR